MEQENLVVLDFENPMPVEQQYIGRSIPCVSVLFKQIQNETEALKQLKQIKSQQTNVYEKIKKTLEKKLGLGRIYRGISANQEFKIKQMIETCKQRKHVRSRNLSNLSNFRTDSARRRNLSAKQKVNRSQQLTASVSARPLTGRPKKQRPRSSQLSHKYHKSQEVGLDFMTIDSKKNEKEIKKNCSHRQYSKLLNSGKRGYFKNIDELETKNTSINEQNFSGYQQERRKQHKQIQIKFKNIIQTCDNQKEDIVCIGRKIGHFEYFCQKMNNKKSKIQKFCKQADALKSTFEQSQN